MAITYETIDPSVLKSVELWAAFYRENPHRFAEDVLNLRLKRFQKILLVEMSRNNAVSLITARGLGKSYISAIFCVIRAILYPGSKICIASGTRAQSINVLQKILLELKPKSPALAFEISEKDTQTNGTNAQIVFKNGSFIKVVTSGESARGNRANILIIDEFRLVSKETVDTILKKFLSNNRMPDYSELSKKERFEAYEKEQNKTLYLSSAYFSDSWAYKKCESLFELMLDEKKHAFVCGFPYQLAIAENLLSAEAVADQMAESDFNEISWGMEMCAEWFGMAEDAWFDFDSISRNCRIKLPMLPSRLSRKLGNNPAIKVQPKKPGEIRILSADIALMTSRKHDNDASSLFINQMMPTKAGRYTSNIIYGETFEGAHTEDQARTIRMLFDEYDCDYLVIDAQGVGSGVTDILMRDINDPESGEVYPALSCFNNPEMAARCTVPGAPKVIYAVKAGAQFNSDCAYKLREGFRSGRVRLLLTEYDGKTELEAIKGFNTLEKEEKELLLAPYVNTTKLINELIKLQYEESNGRVSLHERSGMRKDRYSSLAYNYYVATQIENKMNKKYNIESKSEDFYIIRPPSSGERRGVRKHGWY